MGIAIAPKTSRQDNIALLVIPYRRLTIIDCECLHNVRTGIGTSLAMIHHPAHFLGQIKIDYSYIPKGRTRLVHVQV